MLLFINEIDFNAFGPFNDVDGTDVKLFRAMFKSYMSERKPRIPVNKTINIFFSKSHFLHIKYCSKALQN